MDRNTQPYLAYLLHAPVALRKESVDRNAGLRVGGGSDEVALRKESVDRNQSASRPLIKPSKSLSARRAWIEISGSLDDILAGGVALRKESVDRNSIALASIRVSITVALRKESVDRNND